jgi:hypothetical protein
MSLIDHPIRQPSWTSLPPEVRALKQKLAGLDYMGKLYIYAHRCLILLLRPVRHIEIFDACCILTYVYFCRISDFVSYP